MKAKERVLLLRINKKGSLSYDYGACIDSRVVARMKYRAWIKLKGFLVSSSPLMVSLDFTRLPGKNTIF